MAKKIIEKATAKKPPLGLVSYGDFILPPIVPGPEVVDLCDKLDSFYSNYPKQHKRQKPSDLIMGVFYATRPECRSNPDWMSQAANSARDVLYPLFGEGISRNNLIKLFKKYAISPNNRRDIKNREFVNTFDALDKIYKKLSDLTHHGTDLKGFSLKQFSDFSENDFGNLMNDFTLILGKSFSLQQIYIHTIIDVIVQKKKKPKGVKNDLNLIIKANPDARQYFYSKANERWLDWLWDNGFLNAIKEKSENPKQISYRIPELNYLVKVAEKEPKKVVDIMLAVPIFAENFNPEVIDRFLWICSILPVKQLKRIISKINDEQWIPLMGPFNRWGFEYEKMFQKLADTKEYESILLLAKAILAVRPKEEINKDGFAGISTENPFYFNDLSYTKVFERLASTNEEFAEKTLALVTKILSQIISLGGKAQNGEVFPIEETFHLFDVDFFTLELGQKERLSHRDDVRDLAAVIKVLTRQLIQERCGKPQNAHAIYERYIQPLPDSRAMWRLRLFVLSLCPEVFKNELKNSFFRLFKVERYHEIISGTEYEKTLREGFPTLSEDDKRDYVKRVIDYFKKKDEEKENEKENWHIGYGSRILSMIADYLDKNKDLKRQVEKAGFKLDPNYEPEPSIGPVHTGSIAPKGPVTGEEFGKLPITDIAEKLKTDWAPEELRKKNKSDDFFNPLNAEGVGDLIKTDMLKRLQEYIDNAELFFDRNKLDAHYTYSFLRGIDEIFRGKKIDVININWDKLMPMLKAISESGESEKFDSNKRDREKFDAWLSGWTGVHMAVTDIIQELISEYNDKPLIDFTLNREDIFTIIQYLLGYPDPIPEDEKDKSAKIKVKPSINKEHADSDPYTTAINSVRGRAFQALPIFIYQDGKKFNKEDKVKLSSDVVELYEAVLKKEDTLALMFMFGHYLPSFYFRDIEWMQKLLPEIVSTEPDKKDLYLAAWEGYLANNLFVELFMNPSIQKLYERNIALATEEYTKRRYFRDIDEGLAIHLALAFAHYKEFDFEHPLFKSFWANDNPKRHAAFISFIGRSFISGDNAQAKLLLKESSFSKEKLKKFWDWILENYKQPKSLAEFGFWVSTDKEIFDILWLADHLKKTLEITSGEITWEYGLTKSIIALAEAAPSDTLEILRLLLLESGIRSKRLLVPFSVENEWFEAFKILYTNPKTKDDVYTLINDLIREGGSMFWKLEEVLDSNKT